MLQNAKVTAFTVSELLRENKQGIKYTHTLTHTHSLGLIKSQDLEKIQEE